MSWKARIVREIGRIKCDFDRLEAHTEVISSAAHMMLTALRAGGKIMFCGNGGSAADAQHLAAEFMGRYLRDRAPLPALALTVDTSALTAISNDYSFDEVFSRQVRGIGRSGDVLVAISTSGNSPNVLQAVVAATAMDIATIGLTGELGGRLAELATLAIRVPATQTNTVQEMHIFVGHVLCGIIEDELC